jgi:hypothetical protein
LLIAGESAVAEARILVALNAERIAGANSLGRRGADNCQSARGQQSQNHVTHKTSPWPQPSAFDSLWCNPSRKGEFRQLTFERFGADVFLRAPKSCLVWEVSDIAGALEIWQLVDFKPEYQFLLRRYATRKRRSVSLLWHGGEVETVFGFEQEADALEWIKNKPQRCLIERKL